MGPFGFCLLLLVRNKDSMVNAVDPFVEWCTGLGLSPYFEFVILTLVLLMWSRYDNTNWRLWTFGRSIRWTRWITVQASIVCDVMWGRTPRSADCWKGMRMMRVPIISISYEILEVFVELPLFHHFYFNFMCLLNGTIPIRRWSKHLTLEQPVILTCQVQHQSSVTRITSWSGI